MATLQNFDAEIEKTRSVVNQMRSKMEQSGVVLDQFAKADTKLGDVNFDIENARISDVINQQKVMEANIADLIIGLEDATNVFGAEFESMKSFSGMEKFIGIFSKQKAQRMRTERVRNMSLAGNLQELLAGKDLRPRGHAIEARICAESPENGYLPAAGTLRVVREPEGPGIRVDSGVFSGWEVSPFYDSMLAKLVVWAPDREAACARLSQALRETVYLGIPTNVDFLRRVVDDKAFRTAELSTDMLKHRPELAAGPQDPPDDLTLAAAVLCQAIAPQRNGGGNGGGATARGGSTSVWSELAGFRLFEGAR